MRFSARNGSTIIARDSEFASGKSGVFVIGEKMAGTSGVFDNFELQQIGG